LKSNGRGFDKNFNWKFNKEYTFDLYLSNSDNTHDYWTLKVYEENNSAFTKTVGTIKTKRSIYGKLKNSASTF